MTFKVSIAQSNVIYLTLSHKFCYSWNKKPYIEGTNRRQNFHSQKAYGVLGLKNNSKND